MATKFEIKLFLYSPKGLQFLSYCASEINFENLNSALYIRENSFQRSQSSHGNYLFGITQQ